MEESEVQEAPVRQQDPPSKGEKLYQNLTNLGFGEKQLGKREEFIRALQNPESANKIYSGLRSAGLGEQQIGSESEFKFKSTQWVEKKSPSENGSIPKSADEWRTFLANQDKQNDGLRSSGGGSKTSPNSPVNINPFSSKPDMYAPMLLTKQGRDDYAANPGKYHTQDKPDGDINKYLRKPNIVAPLKTAPQTFVHDETKNPLYNAKLQDYNNPDNSAYAAGNADYDKKHPKKDTGSWDNALYRGSTALTEAVTKPLSGIAKVFRDIAGKIETRAVDASSSKEPLYNKDGSLTDYGISVDAGSISDPLGKFIIGLDAYGQNTDKARQAKHLPDTFLGNTASGLIDVAPDIAATTLFPEEKVAEATTGAMSMLKRAINNPFTKWLAVKGGLNSYSEAEEKGDTPGEAIVEGGEGAIRGLASGAEMSLAGGVGAKVSNSAFKVFQDAGMVKGTGILTKAGLRATADAAVFAALPIGHAALTYGLDHLQGKQDDPELWDNAIKEAQSSAGMGMGFSLLGVYDDFKKERYSNTHINEVLGDRQGIAMTNFMSATPEAITEAFNSPITSGDMNAKAVEYANKAQLENDIDKKQQLVMLSQTFAKSSDVKGTAEVILHDKDGFIKGLENSDLSDKDKKALSDKINTVHKTLDPIELEKTDLGAKISEIDGAIAKNSQRVSDDPVEKVDAEIVGEKLQKEKDSLEKQLRKAISKQYDKQPAPVEPAEIGEKPAEVPAEKPTADATVKEEKPDDKPDEIGGNNSIKDNYPYPKKAVEDMTSDEIYQHAKSVKDYQKGLDKAFFGEEGAKEYQAAVAVENSSFASSEKRHEAYTITKKYHDSLTPEQSKVFFGENTNEFQHDPDDLRDIARKVHFIEESENINELANSIKNPLMDFRADDKNGEAKILLKSAARKAIEMGIDPAEMLKRGIDNAVSDLPGEKGEDLDGDKELLTKSILSEIAKTAESVPKEQKQISDEGGVDNVKEVPPEKPPVKAEKEDITPIKKETAPAKEVEEPIVKDKEEPEVEKPQEDAIDKPELKKERAEINKKIQASDKGDSATTYLPYSEKLKMQRRLDEIDKQLNPEKVTAKSGAVPLPFMNEFIEHDIKPLVQKIASGTKEALSAIIKHISPKIGVATKDLDTVTTNLNQRNEEAANIDKLVNGYEKLFDKMKDPERVDFIDRIKRGLKQPTPELQEIADAYKQMDKDLYEQVNAIKGNVAFKEDHFRVLWKKIPGTEKTKGWFGRAKSPLEGSKSFLKKATLVDMSEGIEKGGEPVSTNPFTLFKLAHADAMKFITAHRMFDALKQDGVVKFYKNKGDAPENFVPIKDKIANVYFPVKTEQGGTIIHKAGEWYIEKNAGRIINNLLSEDKIRNTAVGNGLMAIKNATTMIELSLSPYHATAMSLEAMSSDVARGIRKAVNMGLRGDLKSAGQGMLDILKSPFSPKSTFSLGKNYIKLTSEKDFEKSDFGKAFLEKNPLAKEYLHDMFMGGGLTKQDNTYKTNSFQALKDNMAKDNYIGAAIRAIPALNEMIMSPLFDTYIPTLKVGMFMKEFPLTLQENVSRLESGKVTRTELARKTVDFIDDRLGEMNFDNLFWDRSFKTATQLFFRSVTWKLGNARAIGGALPEQGMELYNAAKEGRAPILQPKVAWVLGLAAVHSTISSLIQYGFTGTYPQNIKDLMYPRISNDDDKKRLALPDYGKDISSIAYRGVGEYVKSSLAGDLGKLYDIWNNKDFQGYNIIDPKDGVFEQGKDALKYMMPQPIGVQQVKKDIKNKETLPSAATHFIGFSPAPKYTTNTNIENKIYDLYNSHEGIKSKGQKETRELKDEIRDLYKSGKIPEADKKIEEGLLSGKLKTSDIKYMVDGGNRGTSPDQYFFTQLPDDDKVWLFNQMSDAEKEKYDPKGKVRILAEKEAEAEKSKKVKPYSSFGK